MPQMASWIIIPVMPNIAARPLFRSICRAELSGLGEEVPVRPLVQQDRGRNDSRKQCNKPI